MNGAQCRADVGGTYLWKTRDEMGVQPHTKGCENVRSAINSCGSIHVYVLFHDFLVMKNSEFVIFFIFSSSHTNIFFISLY